jgi:hypothetical protein
MIIASLIPNQVKIEDERVDAFVNIWRAISDRSKPAKVIERESAKAREEKVIGHDP